MRLHYAIDTRVSYDLGKDWLRDAAAIGGRFNSSQCILTRDNINDAVYRLATNYNHNKLVAELGFGFWRYMYANHQFRAIGQILLDILPAKPKSTRHINYNNTHVFNQLANLNKIRNRIAHHEPICFKPALPVKSTTYARQHYNIIIELFQWMQINEAALLYGLDHINSICNEIDSL